MIPFILISGFLGSGKTTLLKNILNNCGQNRRIAIIQNEFAPTGVDGKELKRTGKDFKLVEINNGSVFCVCLLSNFIQTLEKVVEDHQPEMIFLEASGLADPISIAEILQADQIKEKVRLEHIFTIVDAPNFEKGFNLLPRFKHQIMIADTVIVNKTDLLTNDEESVIELIKANNPFAGIIPTTYCDVDFDGILSKNGIEHSAAERFLNSESGDRPEINACVLRTHDKITRKGVEELLNDLTKYCPRVKGFLNLSDGKIVAIHSVFDHVEIDEISDYIGPSELIAFGQGLSVKELRQKFKKNL